MNDLICRAQYAVIRDFDTGFFAAIREADPEQWIECDAREVALHVKASSNEEPVYQTWHTFPGGFPRFLDMRERARKAAEEEQGRSTIDWFAVAMSDSILKGHHD
jgi:hypothetical protein